MTSKRQKQVAQQILETLSELIQFEARDPRLTGVTVMDVQIDRELRYATIYIYSMAGEDDKDDVMDGLAAAAGFLRRELGSRIRLQHTPELRFMWDETPSRATKIDSLLDSLNADSSEDSNSTGEDHDE